MLIFILFYFIFPSFSFCCFYSVLLLIPFLIFVFYNFYYLFFLLVLRAAILNRTRSQNMILDSNSASSKSPDPRVQDSGSSSMEISWENDPRNPFNWPLSKKWTTMFVSYWVAIVVGINATSFTTAAEGLSHEFNVSNSFFEYSFFAVTSWTATAAIVPLATLPMMETFGFRIGYVVCARNPTGIRNWRSTG